MGSHVLAVACVRAALSFASHKVAIPVCLSQSAEVPFLGVVSREITRKP